MDRVRKIPSTRYSDHSQGLLEVGDKRIAFSSNLHATRPQNTRHSIDTYPTLVDVIHLPKEGKSTSPEVAAMFGSEGPVEGAEGKHSDHRVQGASRINKRGESGEVVVLASEQTGDTTKCGQEYQHDKLL